MGMYFLLGVTGIIRSIRAIPAAASAAKAASKNKTATTKLPPLNLEFKIKRPFPFAPAKTVVVPAEDVSMKTQIFKPVLYLSEQQQQAEARRERKASQERWQKDKERLLTLPFRQAGRGLSGAFKGMVRAFTGEGFLSMNVNGVKYNLDITGGWALEDGKAIDRLIKHSPV
jgi:hypothetical protein